MDPFEAGCILKSYQNYRFLQVFKPAFKLLFSLRTMRGSEKNSCVPQTHQGFYDAVKRLARQTRTGRHATLDSNNLEIPNG